MSPRLLRDLLKHPQPRQRRLEHPFLMLLRLLYAFLDRLSIVEALRPGHLVEELAALAVGAVERLVEGLAELGLVLGRHVLLALELVLSVGERAVRPELAGASLLPVLAHLEGQLQSLPRSCT